MAIRTTTKQDDAATKYMFETFAIDFTYILKYVQINYKPEQVYDLGELEEWASENGYERIANEIPDP